MPIAQLMLKLPATFTKEGGEVVACFPQLDIASQGRTQEEAARNLIEATQLFIESCFDRGVLDAVLKQCGFRSDHSPHTADEDALEVPVELLAARNGPASHAC